MIYHLKKDLHRTFSVFEKNKLPPRAYAIPFSDAKALAGTDVRREREASDVVTLLSGAWDFKFYDSLAKLPDRLDTLKVKFDSVDLPCDWQRTGYQEPVYLNCPYEMKTLAPDLPEDMPAAVYRRIIEISDLSKTRILSFLGVANNLSLYVNGKFAGYSEGTHNTAEFDISPLVKEGSNELLVVMFKWCNGSFLEAQDMFRENGIFRDVLLYTYEGAYIWDYAVNTAKTAGGYTLGVAVQVNGAPADKKLTGKLCTADGKVVAEAAADAAAGELDFGEVDVAEWNPEIPTLYHLFITLTDGKTGMTVRNLTGFKTVEIKEGVFLFNGQPVKFKGVNHHDTNPRTGYVMTLADMENDVKLMKSLNVNAVRTSHYPPDPFFLIMADVYGLYVVDEADIETHGCWEMAGDIDYISHDPKWAKHYVDRVKRMYHRDRNHPSVSMWSLGNEAGGYKCQDACYKYLKSTGTSIPVHYEGVVRNKRFHYDVISEMYTSTEEIELMMQGKRKRNDKICREYEKYPFFLCEYAHAMGVGPGNLDEYWDLFYAWEHSMGGCIWEWADHAVYHPEGDKKYKYRYTYGGDHGEPQHDGHFCVDGLVYGDRRLHTGAKEMRVVYRPLRASQAGPNLYCFENTNRFRDSSYIRIDWALLINGKAKESGSLSPCLPPTGAECFRIPHRKPDEEKDCHINFVYTDTETGTVLAEEQLTLNDVPYEYDIEIGNRISATSCNGIVNIQFENGSCTFNAKTGDLTDYHANGFFLFPGTPAEKYGIQPNLYRALIDNDARMRETWANGGLDKLKKSLRRFDVELDDAEVLVTAVWDLKANKKALYEFTLRYEISSMGAMEIKAGLKPLCDEAVTDLPRFGVTLELTDELDRVRYYGRGEAENMPDFTAQAPVGIYEAAVADMFEPYVYPQESGVHCDTKWLKLSGNGGSLTVYADDRLAFSAHPYTQKMIDKAQHQEDLKPQPVTFLSLDGFVRGIGSSSCGPDTRDEYKLDASKGYEFGFTLIPTVE